MSNRSWINFPWALGWLTFGCWLIPLSFAEGQLQGYWPFDGDVLDASGTGNDGTLFGASFDANVPGQLGSGQSLNFNGGSDRVSVAASPTLNSPAFTLSYWVQDPGQIQNFNRITSRGGDSFETAVGDSGNRLFKFYPGPGWTNTTGTSTPGDWNHVAWVANGGVLRAYVDGSPVHTQNLSLNPSGILNIGARHNAVEGLVGNVDDVALFANPLAPSAVQSLASGATSPTDLQVTTVTSDPDAWMQSTVRTSGGPAGTWTPDPLPMLDGTFTVVPSPGSLPNVTSAATDFGVASIGADGGNGSPTGVQYFRTTFDLDSLDNLSATLATSFDNGGQIFINGTELAREVSFDVANFNPPYSTLSIDADGTVTDVTLFDSTPGNFSGFVLGTNEVIVAVRNPDTEVLNAGGFSFRLDITTAARADNVIPEPASFAIWGSVGLVLAGVGSSRRRSPKVG